MYVRGKRRRNDENMNVLKKKSFFQDFIFPREGFFFDDLVFSFL